MKSQQPAANDNAYGNTGSAIPTKTAPSNPATGSTMPDIWPQKKARHTPTPAPLNGRLTASPSGKFCIPTPTASETAFSKVASLDFPMAPKPTPTASPAKYVCCSVNKIMFFFYLFELLTTSPLLRIFQTPPNSKQSITVTVF